ncbi:MAG TPA: DUF3480 domain-containing protein [Terriglobales bacterium]|nr:DUF3480 domain-containing protein [Terriglobales bacterium]
MDSRGTVRDTLLLLAIAVLGTSTQAARSAYEAQAGSPTSAFPYTMEVIPGKLKVRIFLHDIHYHNETIACWSYVTEGLWTLKQKELIFSLRRDSGQKPEDYPHDILDLLEGIYHFAEQGRLVDVGSVTFFGERGFMKEKDLLGIGYIDPQDLPRVETPGPLLAAIFLKGDEATVALALGLTRVTNLLGMKYRYYPCPPWSEVKRRPVVSRKDVQNSVLLKIPKVSIRASYYEEEKRIFLSLLPSAHERLQKALEEAPPDQPLALLTNVDSRANASLVWVSGQKQPAAISPPNSTGSRKTGNFLAFVPEQKENQMLLVEDGYSLFLTNSTWKLIRAALKDGTDVSIPAAKVGEAAVSIEWVKTEYTSPVTGKSYTSERWTTHEPETTPSPKSRAAVSASKIVLLTSESELEASTSAEELGQYIKEIRNVVDNYFTLHDVKMSRDLSIQFELGAIGQAEIRIVAKPELDAASLTALHGQLAAVPARKPRGPVKFEVMFAIRGGTSN